MSNSDRRCLVAFFLCCCLSKRASRFPFPPFPPLPFLPLLASKPGSPRVRSCHNCITVQQERIGRSCSCLQQTSTRVTDPGATAIKCLWQTYMALTAPHSLLVITATSQYHGPHNIAHHSLQHFHEVYIGSNQVIFPPTLP